MKTKGALTSEDYLEYAHQASDPTHQIAFALCAMAASLLHLEKIITVCDYCDVWMLSTRHDEGCSAQPHDHA